MENNDEKRYSATPIYWDNYEDKYMSTGKDLVIGSVVLGWDKYEEFEAFMKTVTPDEALYLGEWWLTDEWTDEYIHVSDGVYSEVNFLSLQSKHENS